MSEDTRDRAAGIGGSVSVQRDVFAPMRDGVELAADIYLPAAADVGVGFPALLCRTPYSKSGPAPIGGQPPAPTGIVAMAHYFAAHGYAVVLQDTRGRYKSGGIWRFLNDDEADGFDMCAWIGRQSWSNGRIGMFGTSYAGGTQHAAALAGAPGLETIIAVDAVSNMGIQGMRNAGAFELRFWNWVLTGGRDESWQGRNGDALVRPALTEMSGDRLQYLSHLPTRRGATPLKHAPEYEDWLVGAMEHGADDNYWQHVNILSAPERYKDIPLYLVGGWYDSWGGNTTANYRALRAAIKGPVYLIMGPWIHGSQGNSAHGQVSFGAEAAIPDQLAWRREWFDRWLKEEDNSVGRSAPFAAPVRIFVMGIGDGGRTSEGLLQHGGYWRDEQEWPPARGRLTSYFLHEDCRLSTDPPAGDESFTSFDFDPADPVPTIGGNISSAEGILLQGGWDQRGGAHVWNWPHRLPLSARRDVLVFQTEPLSEDTEVTGEIEVRLWAASSARDTDFTAKLIDVYPASADFPNGFDLNLEDGIIRARFRESLEVERLMDPGAAYEFRIKLYPTANVFKRGHRIRLDISSSNFPRFDVNPNTGGPLNRHRRLVVATNTVFHNRLRPSRLLLPLVPA